MLERWTFSMISYVIIKDGLFEYNFKQILRR